MKAIIPAAGLGTRFLPLTKAVPKEMLPIGAKPAMQILVEEARRAGADEIVIIISHAKELVRRYFEGEQDISFVYQEEQRGLGHAVLQAGELLTDKSDNVLVLLGDALVFGCDAASEMVALSRRLDNAAVIGCEHVPMEKVSRYGVMKLADGETEPRVVDMVEKPSIEEAPSDLAVAGRYLLPGKIFDLLATQTPGKGGEIQLTDAIRRLIADGSVPLYAYAYPGHRQDIGNPEGYFKALKAFYEV